VLIAILAILLGLGLTSIFPQAQVGATVLDSNMYHYAPAPSGEHVVSGIISQNGLPERPISVGFYFKEWPKAPVFFNAQNTCGCTTIEGIEVCGLFPYTGTVTWSIPEDKVDLFFDLQVMELAEDLPQFHECTVPVPAIEPEPEPDPEQECDEPISFCSTRDVLQKVFIPLIKQK
jgi:hypothetical protein